MVLSLSGVAFLARKSASAVNTAAAAPSRRCARRGPLRPHSAPTRAARRARPLARHTQSGPASAPLLCLADVPCLARRRARCALGPSAPLRPGRPRSAPRLARAPQPPALARPGKAASRLRERRAKVPRRGRCAPPSAAAAGSVVAVIFNNDHYVIRSRRSVSYEAGVLFRVCFRLRRCFSAALAGASRRARLLGCRDPGGRGRLSAAPWEAAFCLWLLSGFSLYF